MPKYVDSQKVKDMLLRIANGRDEYGDIYAAILALEKLPSENVAPRKPCTSYVGVWVKENCCGENRLIYKAFMCENCGYSIEAFHMNQITNEFDFCPNCGCSITKKQERGNTNG